MQDSLSSSSPAEARASDWRLQSPVPWRHLPSKSLSLSRGEVSVRVKVLLRKKAEGEEHPVRERGGGVSESDRSTRVALPLRMREQGMQSLLILSLSLMSAPCIIIVPLFLSVCCVICSFLAPRLSFFQIFAAFCLFFFCVSSSCLSLSLSHLPVSRQLFSLDKRERGCLPLHRRLASVSVLSSSLFPLSSSLADSIEGRQREKDRNWNSIPFPIMYREIQSLTHSVTQAEFTSPPSH